MDISREEYEERIKIAFYRGASYGSNQKEIDIDEAVRITLSVLEQRTIDKNTI